MFAEMLGIRQSVPEPPAPDPVPPAPVPESPEGDGVPPTDLEIQREVVNEMASEKVEPEETCDQLKARIAELEARNQELETRNQELQVRNQELESREAEQETIRSVRAENAFLEEKVVQLGRALISARRAAAEASKVVIGGRKW